VSARQQERHTGRMLRAAGWTLLRRIAGYAAPDPAQRLLGPDAMRTRFMLATLLLWSACSAESDEPPEVDPVEDGCPGLFAQEILPDFHVDIDDDEWAAMEDEFLHRAERLEAGMDEHPYHPIVFSYEDDVVEDAMIRLKGASSWNDTVAFDDDPKMQFVISFNENNPDGRYRGRRKLALDMPRSDWTFLRQRLALHALRSLGAPAQCANSARLFINGDYYGLYANVERMDRELLERLYPENPDGDLWEGGRIIKTNEDDFTWTRLSAFWDVAESGTIDDLEQLADLDASIKEWAAEAVLPHADGYYMGRANFYLYDHPDRGFTWMPNDLDTAFDYVEPDADALYPACDGRKTHDREHYLIVMDDPVWRDRYIDELAKLVDRYDVADMELRLDQWAAQIEDAAAHDPRAPFSAQDRIAALDSMRDYFAERATFLEDWVGCRDSGGPDGDDDGVEFCLDCDDASADVGPAMTETCDGIDNDCDGHVDELADCSTDQ
jgi:hypothetical protein